MKSNRKSTTVDFAGTHTPRLFGLDLVFLIIIISAIFCDGFLAPHADPDILVGKSPAIRTTVMRRRYVLHLISQSKVSIHAVNNIKRGTSNRLYGQACSDL